MAFNLKKASHDVKAIKDLVKRNMLTKDIRIAHYLK